MPTRIASVIGAGAFALLALVVPAAAQDRPHPQPGAAETTRPQAAAARHTLLPADSVTKHTLTLGARSLDYTATAGTLPLTDDKGEITAEIFYVSFTLDGANRDRRPVTYLFNGGPGAASAYLDIGAVGPRALAFGENGAVPTGNVQVGDNQDSWLPFTDLVFIDPVGTAYSRATGGDDAAAKQFWSVAKDLEALGDIIRLHLTRSGRLSSPVYLVGESYGGFRVARLAHDLGTGHGVTLAGAMMISPVIDFGLMTSGPLDVLGWALRVPSYAAAALGPKALEPGALADAESFAMKDLIAALVAGPRDDAASRPIYERLAQLTGLDVDSVAEWRGRIPLGGYLYEVRRREGQVVSRYDGTVAGTDPNPWNEDGHDDPVLDRTIAPFTTAFVAYARDELGFKTDLPFELLNREVEQRWDWRGQGRASFRVLGASEALRRALANQPALKVLIAHGVADLQTPYMMSRYIKDQMPAALGDRIALKLYAGGHMMYLRAESRHRLHDDAQAFYGGAAE